jgi:hypothetical protein
MEIECPSCSQKNAINMVQNMVCAKCKNSLSGHHYRVVKGRVFNTTLAIAFGAFGFNSLENRFEQTRYPVKTEYSIVDACVNAHKRPLRTAAYSKKKDVCVCLLEKTMRGYTLQEFKDSQAGFLNLFETNINRCE